MAGLLGALGFIGAGGAVGYANARNAQTEALSKVEMALISAEAEDMYKQRSEERAGLAEAAKHERDIGREDFKYGRDRADKLADTEATQSHDLKKIETTYGYKKDLEGVKQSAAEKRTRISQDGALERARMGLLNNSSRGSSSELSQKDITRANESDRKRIFDLRKEATDPMISRNTEKSKLLKDEIARLEDAIAERLHGNPKPNISAITGN